MKVLGNYVCSLLETRDSESVPAHLLSSQAIEGFGIEKPWACPPMDRKNPDRAFGLPGAAQDLGDLIQHLILPDACQKGQRLDHRDPKV